MPLQLIGLSRCTECSAEELVWKCAVCDTTVHGNESDDADETVSLQGIRCGGCGADREVVTYVVPETLTDFWVYDIRSAEKISRVEFSEVAGRPTALHLRRRVIGVEGMLFFVRVADDAPAFGPTPHGAYVLRTELGLCVVVCAPHELGEGEVSTTIADWYLVEADASMRSRLKGQQKLAGREPVQAGSVDSSDEGLLRNSLAYRIVYRIENALRELVSERLKEKVGGTGRWWKAAAPKTLREQVVDVETRRRDAAWFEVPSAEPMIFTTLGQLRDLLDKDWGNLGQGLGPKEVTLGALRKVEFYRNELAHCRPLTLRMLSDLHEVERSLMRITNRRRQGS